MSFEWDSEAVDFEVRNQGLFIAKEWGRGGAVALHIKLVPNLMLSL